MKCSIYLLQSATLKNIIIFYLINLWTRQSNQQLLDKYDLAMEAWNKREKLSISINLIVIKKET